MADNEKVVKTTGEVTEAEETQVEKTEEKKQKLTRWQRFKRGVKKHKKAIIGTGLGILGSAGASAVGAYFVGKKHGEQNAYAQQQWEMEQQQKMDSLDPNID